MTAHASATRLFLAGVAIAFVASMCGIGGGLFAVPLLHFGMGMRLRQSVATALCLVLATALTSTTTQFLHAREALQGDLIAALIAGALVGTQVGYRAARAIPLGVLRGVFVLALAIAGQRLLFAGAGPTETELLLASRSARVGIALLAGLLGGFAAPLLGIGGGLVIVPVLFLSVPGADFAVARACSLATAVVTSGRSLRLYLRDGEVDLPRGMWLGAGAVLGAVGGVLAVHRPGWIDAARALFGLILWFVALRFALDLMRRRPDGARAD